MSETEFLQNTSTMVCICTFLIYGRLSFILNAILSNLKNDIRLKNANNTNITKIQKDRVP